MKQLLPVVIMLIAACNNAADTKTKTADSTANPEKAALATMPHGDCTSLFWFKKGTVMEYKITDSTGNTTFTTRSEITDVHNDNGEMMAEYTSTVNGKTLKGSYKCSGDKVYSDLSSLFDSPAFKQPGVEVDVKQGYLSMPRNAKPGDELEEATFEIHSKMQGQAFMDMVSKVTNRKVAAIEKVKTAAGSWDCLKITQDQVTTTTIRGRQVSERTKHMAEWFSPVAGLVKSETYNNAGSVTSRSELTAIH